MKNSILIADDDYLLTLQIETMLTSNDHEVAGIACNSEEAIQMTREKKPTLVLMDIKMPGKMDGIDAAKKILSDYGTPCIFLSGHDDRALVERAKRVNPLSYLLKPITERQILLKVELAFYKINTRRERQFFSTDVFPQELPCRYVSLTPTKIRVASLIRKGRSSKEVAVNLNISEQTVMWHRKNIRKKLNLVNTDENLTINLLS